jgi:DNA-binding transcriptional LysR family regulator
MAHIRPALYLESSSPQTLLGLAATGRGIAIVPATVALEGTGLHSCALLQEGAPLELRFAVHWNPQRYFPPYAAVFVTELEAVARERFTSQRPARAVRVAED